MSKRINPTSIGLFIVVGVVLGVMALLLVSSSTLFSQRKDVIVYFENSLNGLSEGAPVKFRGVTIGVVKRIMIHFNQDAHDYALPVILEMDEKLLRRRWGGDSTRVFTAEALEHDIRNGLRATLEAESLVTGVLYVGLGFHPEAPPPVFHQLQRTYLEVPSRPSEVQQLMNNLASLDLKSIEKNLNALLIKLNTSVSGLQLAQLQGEIIKVLASVNRLVSSPDVQRDLVALGMALDQYRLLGEKVANRVDPLADDVARTLAEADRALVQVRGAANNVRLLLAPDAPIPNDLDRTLHELSAAVQSLSSLLDFLKQHPNALVVGRENVPRKP